MTAQMNEAPERKRFANLRARLALKGYEMVETEAGTYIVSRWNLCKQVHDLDAAEAFALQAGCQS